jgi:hypothetical protein
LKLIQVATRKIRSCCDSIDIGLTKSIERVRRAAKTRGKDYRRKRRSPDL